MFFKKIRLYFTLVCIYIFCAQSGYAFDKTNRLGLGASTELQTNFPALSFKMQKNKTFAFGGLLGVSSDAQNGGQGVGIKLYRNIFDEPQLNFYMAGMGAFLNNKVNSTSYSGFQFDLSFGSEFHFSGLNSLGLSFEFGVSAYKLNNFIFRTLGNNFFVSSVHFYL
jgi:hypothetical protein